MSKITDSIHRRENIVYTFEKVLCVISIKMDPSRQHDDDDDHDHDEHEH